ncbi:germination protein YpeB [Oceanobacillus chungangensis]|uniref:Germination protein YpeB n=1 Tax=Oceanobacillus chungangensis TaxID=1229152 RepID=A0A3D8Q2V6_9BACI|nr:germination protein YpeB [Oceanobacillus chungangensis]RDW22031.1 germination protein YpeB [Oceanobacillus chungangensis]
MIRWILVTVLALGIAGTAYWGYQEHQEKNEILIQAENTYQRAFHELSYHMDMLHDEIGTVLAMNSDKRLSPQMVEIWRLTSEASSNVGQLPLGLLPFNKTEELLANIGDFSYKTAVRNLDDKPLTDEEMRTLEKLYTQSGDIKDELRHVQNIAMNNNLRWMDVQLAIANGDEQTDNSIIDGLKTVEKSVEGFSAKNVDNSLIGGNSSLKEHKYELILTSDNVTENEALRISQELFNTKENDEITITESGEGANIPLYSTSFHSDKMNAYMDMTKQGGHPITLLIDRPVNEKNISLNEGSEKAKAYVDDLEFQSMELFQSTEYGNIGAYSFLYNQDGVRVYSDAIELKVALDNGEITGLTAKNYLMNHKEREIQPPAISEEEAREFVNPNVNIQEHFLAIIDNDFGEEVLVHEFLGVLGNDTYRIFINAMDGVEEKVEKLGGTEVNYQSTL